MTVALIALFAALAGSAYAATKIDTKNIKKGAVTAPKVAKGAIKGGKIAKDAVKGGKIKDGSVSEQKLNGGTVAKINSVEGKQGACEPGSILAYAQVELNPGAAFAPVDGFNCKGGTIEARRTAVGVYEVRWQNFVFDSTTEGIVVHVTPVGGSGGTISGYGTTASDDLRVNTYDHQGSAVDKLFSVSVVDAGPQE